MNNATLMKLILAFVTLIIASVLIVNVATNTTGVTDKRVANNESLAFTPASVNGTLNNETQTFKNVTGNTTSVASYPLVSLGGVVIINATSGVVVPSTNYTISGGTVVAHATSPYVNTLVNVSSTFTYFRVNETQTLIVTNYPSGWKVNDCPLTDFALRNSSGSAMTLTTHYTVTLTSGQVLLKNVTGFWGSIGPANKTYVDYTYCGDDYLNQSFGRNISDMVPGFFALAALAISIGLFFSVGRDFDIW